MLRLRERVNRAIDKLLSSIRKPIVRPAFQRIPVKAKYPRVLRKRK